jgi:hypothetical protein
MSLEEKPRLQPLPLEGFRFFAQETRTVDDSGLIQVDGSYYAALPAPLYSEVTVRTYEREIAILDPCGQRHGEWLHSQVTCYPPARFVIVLSQDNSLS